MTLTLATACYKRYDLLVQMIASAERGSRKPDRYVLVDNGGLAHAEALPPGTLLYKPGTNIGVAAAVNWIFRHGDDLTIWTNDDVLFEPHTLGALEDGALACPEGLFFLPRHNAGSAFTVFLARKQLFETMGWFDERFYPAYFEDNDFAYRMQLAGIAQRLVDTSYFHHQSATMQAYDPGEMQAHHGRFEANQQLYQRKWGGPPGRELWKEPHA